MDGTPRAGWVNQPSENPQAKNPDWNKSESPPDASNKKDAKPKPEPMVIVDPRTLEGKPVPERRWIVPGWLPFGYTTALYGDGGTGKTLLAQQLMTSCATGVPWLGMSTMPCPVFGLFCEDDEDELHRRQDAINAHCGINFSDLGNMRWVSGVGADNFLVSFDYERMIRLPRFEELTKAALDFQARLVIVDTAADTFGGNENDRSQVRQYVGAGLNRLARALDGGRGGAVLLNAHPSRFGMSGLGDGDGASTAWSNTVRSRLSLVRPKDDGETKADSDERILSRKKANYASIGTEIRLRWQRGVLAPVQPAGGGSRAINRSHAEAVFLELLDAATAQNRNVSDSKNGGNYAPKLFAASPNRKGLAKVDFLHAMEGLFAEDKITMEDYGRKGDPRRRIVRVQRDIDEAKDACGG
jgi:RecA-family ATPase